MPLSSTLHRQLTSVCHTVARPGWECYNRVKDEKVAATDQGTTHQQPRQPMCPSHCCAEPHAFHRNTKQHPHLLATQQHIAGPTYTAITTNCGIHTRAFVAAHLYHQPNTSTMRSLLLLSLTTAAPSTCFPWHTSPNRSNAT